MRNSEIESLAKYLSFMYGLEEKGLIGNIATWCNTPKICFDTKELPVFKEGETCYLERVS